MVDHVTAGSIQCQSWKSNQEVTDLLELPQISSPEISTVYQTVFFVFVFFGGFFFYCKIRAVDRKMTAFHGTFKDKRNAHRLQL